VTGEAGKGGGGSLTGEQREVLEHFKHVGAGVDGKPTIEWGAPRNR